MRTMSVEDTWLSGDALCGALLRGWGGPVTWFAQDERKWHDGLVFGESTTGADGRQYEWIAHERASYTQATKHATYIRLHCTRREVRRNIVDVLMAGDRCAECGGTGKRGPKMSAYKWSADGMISCETCSGTGYRRPPHDLTCVTVAELRGEITLDDAAGILWCSVLRVEAGLGPVLGLHVATAPGRFRRVAGDVRLGTGTERPDDVAADTHALREPGALLLPHPDGPVRLEVTP